jgi:hypothetical protein
VALTFAACGPPAGFESASDVAKELEAARAVTPLPPGRTFPPLPSLDPGGAYDAGHGRYLAERQAMCAWFRYWAEAIAKDDEAAIRQASAMWDEIRTWSAYRNFDERSREDLDSMVERARLGDPSGLLDRVVKNCG